MPRLNCFDERGGLVLHRRRDRLFGRRFRHVNWAILLRSQGSNRPDAFALEMLAQVPGHANVRIVKTVCQHQQKSAYPGIPSRVANDCIGTPRYW